jgi:hypothetical protein
MSSVITDLRLYVPFKKAIVAHFVAGLMGATLWPTLVHAQEESRSADVAAARELAIEGLKLAETGQCIPAVDRLSRAEKLHHAPIVLGRLGECEIAIGRIVDGTEDLRRLLREVVPSNPTPALVKALARAQGVLDQSKGRIALLNISVREPATNVTVTVDGQLVPQALFDRGRPTDPGEHNVEATAPGYLKASRVVNLTPGEKQELNFRLTLAPESPVNPKAATATVGAHKSQVPRQPSSKTPQNTTDNSSVSNEARTESPSYTPSYVLWSVGAASAAVGGVFGFLALKGKRDLDKSCTGNSCPPSSQSQLDSARRDATLSTVLLATGGGLLAVGTVVYLVTGTNTEKPPSNTSASVEPVLGLGQVGLQGVF